ncbi:MAG: thioredoxin domain-containing protein [Gemmatimonadaceae bacterium]|nr:thioredoxin domain-containing protein [Gemmatimonadaceae bacterium]
MPATDVRQLPEERKARVPDVMMVAADRGRVLGSDSAAVRMLIVSDYQCAECRTLFDSVLPALRTGYVDTGRARITWVHYPLKRHPGAVRAASAALCASAQGRFWDASAALFAAQEAWGAARAPDAMIDSLASLPGIDAYALRNCTASGRMLRQIRGDIDWTDTVRAGKPPTIVIGTRHLDGTLPLARLRATLDSAIAGR